MALVKCPMCKNELNGETVCSNCGTNISKVENKICKDCNGILKICPSCGKIISAFDEKCPTCGYNIVALKNKICSCCEYNNKIIRKKEDGNMSFIKCPECGNKIQSTSKICPNCGYPLAEQLNIKQSINVYQSNTYPPHKNSHIIKLMVIRRIFVVMAIVCFVLSAILFSKGYDVKNKYSNQFSSNKNAYVGGDAYNYIINGTYFTGYSVIASSTLLSGFILISNIVNITLKLTEK